MVNDTLVIDSESIPAMAYKGGIEIRKILIGKNVKTIGAEAFAMCPNLQSIEVDIDNECFTSGEGSNAIIDKVSGVLLTGCYTTVIPQQVTEIGPFAFCGQTRIESVRIPSNVRKVSAYAFDGCSNIIEIILEEGVECLSEYCFRNTTNLQIVRFPSSLHEIERTAFGVEMIAEQGEGEFSVDFVGGPEKIATIYYSGTKSQYRDFQGWLNSSLNPADKENVVVICKDGVYNDDQSVPDDTFWETGIF